MPNRSAVPSVIPAQNLRIAVVDDDDLYRQYVANMLASHAGISVRQAAGGDALLSLLDSDTFDCIVLDNVLRAESGLSVGEAVGKRYADPPPIIMLTGEGSERTVAKAFRAGFSDYVSKRDLNPEELLAAIRGAVERNAKALAEKEAKQRLDRLSAFDPTTGLYARHYILENLDEILASATRRSACLALLLVRMGKLDSIRDQFGHAMGDRALRAFALRLQKAARKDDLVGRYGKDSFLYLIDREPHAGTVGQIRQQLAREMNFEAHFDRVSLSLSGAIGVATFPADGIAAETLLQAAERQLDLAQSSASDTGHVWSPKQPFKQASRPSAQVVDLRSERRQRVLKRGQIVLPERSAVIDCTIRDMSSKGARLSVEHYFAPLERFDLKFVATGDNRPAQTRWQIGSNVGVEFVA